MKRWTGLRLVAVLMALLVGGFGCTASESTTSGGVPANGATLDADAFAAAMATAGTVILDVRTPAEFASGHIEGAVNIDVGSPDFGAKIGELDKGASYAVYCRSGNRSATALSQMDAAGFTQAYHLGGGVQAWASSGRALVGG